MFENRDLPFELFVHEQMGLLDTRESKINEAITYLYGEGRFEAPEFMAQAASGARVRFDNITLTPQEVARIKEAIAR